MNPQIASMENIIARDPGGRNIFALVIADQLRLAAQSLLQARRVGIVTGFFIPSAGAGETDGPPGAVVLGQALRRRGVTVDYLTDERNAPILRALSVEPVLTFTDYLGEAAPTHLIAIERVGRAFDGRYRNMRGDDITDVTAPLDQLFLNAPLRGVTTIGIGDGGNEIGMGKVFADALTNVAEGPRIASVVATDYCIAAGVANWGAYGLTAALCALTGEDLLPASDEIVAQIEACVRNGGAVDGKTCSRTLTVDGLDSGETVRTVEELRTHLRPATLSGGCSRRVGIIGFGQTGRATARLLASHGHRVFVSEAKPGQLADAGCVEKSETGAHSPEFLMQCDLVVTSPGVSPTAEIVEALRRAGKPVMSGLEAADQLCDREIIAITGTTGKRTTVELIGELMNRSGAEVSVGGNKGRPLAEILCDRAAADRIALAVSSFQLETVVHFRPHIAVILNIRDAHLDRHRSVAEYIRTKSRIFMNHRPDDVLILPWADERLRVLGRKHNGRTLYVSDGQPVSDGAWREGETVFVRINGVQERISGPAVASYPFVENLLAGVLACRLCGVEAEAIEGALNRPLPGAGS